jgi:hypothetical protein
MVVIYRTLLKGSFNEAGEFSSKLDGFSEKRLRACLESCPGLGQVSVTVMFIAGSAL